jgi:hypothetical protein
VCEDGLPGPEHLGFTPLRPPLGQPGPVEPWTAGVHLRPALLASGFDDDELHRLRRAGEIVAVRRGAYVAAAGVDARPGGPPREVIRHLHAVRAAAAQLGEGAVISHVSAALLYGLPLWATALDRVHATRDRRSGARRTRDLHMHAAALEPDEIVLLDGLLVTSPERTLLDIARSLPFEQALIPADAALHRHLVKRGQLEQSLCRAAHRRGNAAARQVLAFARAGAESPGETRSRVAIHRAGLPPPVLQHEVRTVAGLVLGKVDFWWEEYGVAGEFDGRVKYGRVLKPGQDPGEVVFREKVREDAIRAEIRGMTRWTWPELDPFDGVAGRIRRVFGRG